MDSSKPVITGGFAILLTLGHMGTWGVSGKNEFFKLVEAILDDEVGVFPGTDVIVRRQITGLKSVDWLLALLNISFWPIFDGQHANLSLYHIQFAGQYLAICLVILLEGRRLGNKWRIVSFVSTWILLFQAAGFACVIPAYAWVHLRTSPTAQRRSLTPNGLSTNFLISMQDLIALPVSVLAGYVLPVVLVAVPAPGVVSYDTHQIFMSSLQLFPVAIAVVHFLLSGILTLILNPRYESAADRNLQSLHALRWSYLLGILAGSITHVAALTHSLTSMLLPALYRADVAAAFHPSQIFGIPAFLDPGLATSIAEGMLTFMKFDQLLGGLSALIWAMILYGRSQTHPLTATRWIGLVGKVVVLSLLLGPGTAFALLFLARDEAVLGDPEVEARKVF